MLDASNPPLVLTRMWCQVLRLVLQVVSSGKLWRMRLVITSELLFVIPYVKSASRLIISLTLQHDVSQVRIKGVNSSSSIFSAQTAVNQTLRNVVRLRPIHAMQIRNSS